MKIKKRIVSSFKRAWKTPVIAMIMFWVTTSFGRNPHNWQNSI
ncbi:hypothetical protein [Lederbergia citrisecunda]|nr:hypothetical protein [Lederbergia citrisecunda]